MPAVGIDFGTANALVAISHNGKVEVIEHDDGRQLACCVAFTNTERLVGRGAIHQLPTNPENTVCCVKRLLGQTMDKINNLKSDNLWQFQLEKSEFQGKPKVSVKYKQDQEKFYPEELASVILSKLKQIAEKRLTEVTAAVITVPPSFNYEQRQATIDAAKIAGILKVQLVNETTAVSFDCCLREEVTTKKNVLIFHLGGGSANVAVVEVEKKTIKVISTKGLSKGGEDFTLALFNYAVDNFKPKSSKAGLESDKNAKCRLWLACEKAKKDLSISDVASINVDSLLKGKSFSLEVKREKFEELTKDLVISLIQTAKNIPNGIEIDSIYFVGGGTRLPHFQREFLKTFQNWGNKVLKTVNVDEAAALGAARLAELMFDHKSQDRAKNTATLECCGIQDILSYSIHLDFGNKSMKKVFGSGTPIPTTITLSECHTASTIKAKADDDRLRDLDFHDHSSSEVYTISLTVDENGILDVSKLEKAKVGGVIDQEELNCLIERAEKYEKEEKAQTKLERQLHEFQCHVFDEKKRATENNSLSDKARKDFGILCQKTHDWIQTTEVRTEDEINDKKKKFNGSVKDMNRNSTRKEDEVIQITKL